MPSSEEPIDVNEPNEPPQAGPEAGSSEPSGPTPSESLREPEAASPVVRNSRWVDYDTYELLEMISELEDERRWARLREGVWLAILVHLALLSALTLVPKYIFKVPVVVDRSQIIDQHKDFTYLDSPALPPKVTVKPVPVKPGHRQGNIGGHEPGQSARAGPRAACSRASPAHAADSTQPTIAG